MMSDKIVRLHLTAYCDHRFIWLVNNYADFAGNTTFATPLALARP